MNVQRVLLVVCLTRLLSSEKLITRITNELTALCNCDGKKIEYKAGILSSPTFKYSALFDVYVGGAQKAIS